MQKFPALVFISFSNAERKKPEEIPNLERQTGRKFAGPREVVVKN